MTRTGRMAGGATALFLGVLMTAPGHAAECNRKELDVFEHFAGKVAELYVEKRNYGGRNIRVSRIKSCSYNSYSKVLRGSVLIEWAGNMDPTVNYWAEATIGFDLDKEGEVSFDEGRISSNLRENRVSEGVLKFLFKSMEGE